MDQLSSPSRRGQVRLDREFLYFLTFVHLSFGLFGFLCFIARNDQIRIRCILGCLNLDKVCSQRLLQRTVRLRDEKREYKSDGLTVEPFGQQISSIMNGDG